MVSKIGTFAFNGVEAIAIEVQCQLASGLPSFNIVGLPDKTVAESRDRVRAVFATLGLSFPAKRVIINLSPADIHKDGSHFDLPIILSILATLKILPQEQMENYFCMGEIGLDGNLISTSGVLPAAIAAAAANKGLICPVQNAQEAVWASSELDVLPAKHILDITNHFKGTQILARPALEIKPEQVNYPDFKDVKGQEIAKRAAEISAAGGHNMLMVGPPGSGKSMIASRIPGIMPELSPKEILETSMIYSISGNLREGKLVVNRPYRAPHHNVSMPAMIGGGAKVKPGEISLSHNGVLFLDELPEFPRQVLDSLRQPLETGDVTVSRVKSHVTYPANFQLVAAMNPCKCGYLDDASRACTKAPKCATEYQHRLSGPFLDRIDIHVEVPAQNPLKAYEEKESESSSAIRRRVFAAHKIQQDRFRGTEIRSNAEIEGDDLEKFCVLDDDAKDILHKGTEKLRLSMRGHARVLRVARTIADLDSSGNIAKKHIAEALSYREINYSR
jgi:magnesium chelatase family protein